MDVKVLILSAPEQGKRLLGLTLLERAILSLSRAGIRDIRVAVPCNSSRSEDIINRSRPLKLKGISCTVVRNKGELAATKGKFLLIRDTTVFDWKGAARLLQSAAAATRTLKTTDGSWAAEFLTAASAKKQLQAYFDNKIALQVSREATAFPGWGALSVTDETTYRKARRALLVSMRKPTDGFVSRNFNRYVSLCLTRFFLVLRLTPNSISFANLGLGVLGAILIATTAATGDYWKLLTGGLIFQLTSIIDGCDGEVAKLSFSDSDKGEWIDTLCDQLGYFSFFIGLPIGLYNKTHNLTFLVLGGMTFIFIGLLFYMMSRYVKRRGEGGSMLLIIKDLEAESTKKGWFAVLNKIVFGMNFIFRRDFFACFVMLFCISNQVWLLQWIISIFLTLQCLYIVFFSWYTGRNQE